MVQFALRRIAQSVVIVVVIAIAVFIVLRLSAGDPAPDTLARARDGASLTDQAEGP